MQMKMHRNTDGYRHWRTGRPQVDQKYTYRRACHGCSMYLGLGGKLSPKSLTFGVGPFLGGEPTSCSALPWTPLAPLAVVRSLDPPLHWRKSL